MSRHPWLPLLSGTVLAGLMVGSLSLTEPPCAYVLGQVGTVTVATPALVLFVPASAGLDVGPEAGAAFHALPAPHGRPRTCSNLGVSTLAVPVSVPTSVLDDGPGALLEVQDIALTLQDTPVTVPGHVLTLEGRTLFLPLHGAPPEPVAYDLPKQSIVLGPADSDENARYLAPRRK